MRSPFLDSTDALRHALRGEGRNQGHGKSGGGLIKISFDSMSAPNGQKYFCVQVSHLEISYRVHAYGDEAERLYEEVQKHVQFEKEQMTKTSAGKQAREGPKYLTVLAENENGEG